MSIEEEKTLVREVLNPLISKDIATSMDEAIALVKEALARLEAYRDKDLPLELGVLTGACKRS